MKGAIGKRLDQLNKQFTDDTLAKEGFKYFRSITPIRSGNARRNTFLSKNEIEANYPYARRLDEGYSPQAREGMTQPTIAHMQEWIKKQSKG
jgi:hypothetical protein